MPTSAPLLALSSILFAGVYNISEGAQSTTPPINTSATLAPLVDWCATHATPLSTVEPNHGFADLNDLREQIGNAKIVALGEPTHGTKEVFQLKHRLIEYLFTELGFSMVAFELNMPEAQLINDYVHGAAGDVNALLKGTQFWSYSSQEIRDLVEWMRQYNADPANQARGRQIDCAGFDMCFPSMPANIVRQFMLDHNRAELPRVSQAIAALKRLRGYIQADSVLGELPPDLVAGKRIVFSGWIKTKDLSNGWAGLSMKVSDRDGRSVLSENMPSTGPKGTTEWRHYEIATTLPASISKIHIGAHMHGQGHAWFDDLQLSIDGVSWDPSEKFNFDFESSSLAGFNNTNPYDYAATLSPEAHQGKQSLHLQSVAVPGEDLAMPKVLERWRNIEATISSTQIPVKEALNGIDQDWAARNAHLVVQAIEMQLKLVGRDTSMAYNVEGLIERHPDAKVILWAHNGHIARQTNSMGGILAKRYGYSLRIVGLTLGHGYYHALSHTDGIPGQFPIPAAKTNSVEALFEGVGMPLFILDLRSSRASTVSTEAWFAQRHFQRGVGTIETRDQFLLRRPGLEYDLLAWIEESHPSVLLP